MLIVCCGLPRSGSTLQFNIVRSIGRRRGWRELEWMPAERLAAEIPVLIAESMSVPIMLKSHTPPLTVLEAAENLRLLTTVRDLRDVAASNLITFGNPVVKTIADLSRAIELLEALSSGRPDNTLVSRYEVFSHNISVECQKIGAFLGVDVQDDEARQIDRELNVDTAYRKSRAPAGSTLRHLVRRINFRLLGRVVYKDQELRLHANHVSEYKGRSKYYREVLSADDVARIEEAFHEFMTKHQYE